MKPPPFGICAPCLPLRVLDVDTLDVEIIRPKSRLQLRLRLLDCWGPEAHLNSRIVKQYGATAAKAELDYGKRAKEFTVTLIAEIQQRNEPVPLFVPMEKDLFDILTLGRVLGHLWPAATAAHSVSELIYRAGMCDRTKQEQEARWAAMYGKK